MDSAKKFEDLIIWQLAVKLRDRVYEMTEKGPVLRDQEFLDQIRESAASVPSNISEGFVRFEPHEMAPYIKTAKASLGETQNHLKHGRTRRYFSEADFTEAWRLACRAFRGTSRLHAYLRGFSKKKRFVPPRKPANPSPQPQQRPRRARKPAKPVSANPVERNPAEPNPRNRTPRNRTPRNRTPRNP